MEDKQEKTLIQLFVLYRHSHRYPSMRLDDNLEELPIGQLTEEGIAKAKLAGASFLQNYSEFYKAASLEEDMKIYVSGFTRCLDTIYYRLIGMEFIENRTHFQKLHEIGLIEQTNPSRKNIFIPHLHKNRELFKSNLFQNNKQFHDIVKNINDLKQVNKTLEFYLSQVEKLAPGVDIDTEKVWMIADYLDLLPPKDEEEESKTELREKLKGFYSKHIEMVLSADDGTEKLISSEILNLIIAHLSLNNKKFIAFCGHDTNMMALMKMAGVSIENREIHFNSELCFEIYEYRDGKITLEVIFNKESLSSLFSFKKYKSLEELCQELRDLTYKEEQTDDIGSDEM